MQKTFTLLFILLLTTEQSRSATFCVKNSMELDAALQTAGLNGESDLIKIANGTYISDGTGFGYNGPIDFDIEISGGWSLFLGNFCGIQVYSTPFNTVIDGNHSNRAFYIEPSNSSDVKVTNLMFTNGVAPVDQRGGGLNVQTLQSYMGNISILNNAFINNTAKFGGGLKATGNKMYIMNNLFVANHSIINANISLISNFSTGVYFINNTVLNNTTDNTLKNSYAGVYISVNKPSAAYIANNIISNNDFHDLRINGDGEIHLINNNIDGTYLGTPTQEFGNFIGRVDRHS